MNSFRRMAGWYPGRPVRACAARARDAKVHQIKLINKQINHPNQVILVDPVLKTVRKQRHLIPINPFNET